MVTLEPDQVKICSYPLPHIDNILEGVGPETHSLISGANLSSMPTPDFGRFIL